MGHHDPLDGLITYIQLQSTAAGDSGMSKRFNLSSEIADMSSICKGKSWITDDLLGIGELLSAAYKLAQLTILEGWDQADLLDVLLDDSLVGVQSYAVERYPFMLTADKRLAFRELGLTIGLHAIEKLLGLIRQASCDSNMKQRLSARAEHLMQHIPLSNMIETFWLEPANRLVATWREHRDINMVMLATSLAPDGYLTLG